MEAQVLEEIRDELKELRMLYEELVGCLVAEDTPTPEEKEAIESDDELADEDELWKALR
jgi:hypothetical protein